MASLPNKPMHPTRSSAALISNHTCGRVIGGVRPLLAKLKSQSYAGLVLTKEK
jgi:hypothetical protein